MFDLTPAGLITRILVLLVSVGVHEGAHAYAAYAMGDPTAKEHGRMTFNPIPNIWWPGFLIAIIGGMAILGSAPVNPYRMRNPRWGGLVAVAAGPISSLLLGLLFGIPFLIPPVKQFLFATSGESDLNFLIPTPYSFLWFGMVMNIAMFFLNFIPLFPLDGWHVAKNLLPRGASIWWERNQQNSMYVFFGLIVLGFLAGRLARISPILGYLDIIGFVIWPPTFFIVERILGI